MYVVEMWVEVVQLLFFVWPDDEDVFRMSKARGRLEVEAVFAFLFEIVHKDIDYGR